MVLNLGSKDKCVEGNKSDKIQLEFTTNLQT